MQTIELAMLATPPFALPDSVEATRADLLTAATALNTQIESLPAGSDFAQGSPERAKAVEILNAQIPLLNRIGDYLGEVIAAQPAAASDSLNGLDAAREPSRQSLKAAGLDESHPTFEQSVSSHPVAAAADAAHSLIVNFPAHAWQIANSEIIGQLKRELGKLGG